MISFYREITPMGGDIMGFLKRLLKSKQKLETGLLEQEKDNIKDCTKNVDCLNNSLDEKDINESNGSKNEDYDNDSMYTDDIDNEINKFQDLWKKILDKEEEEKEIKEAQDRYKQKKQEDKKKQEKEKDKKNYEKNYSNIFPDPSLYCSHCGFILPPYYHNCFNDPYDEIERADKKDVAELIYQGYLENENDEYIPEELYHYLNNDYFLFDNIPYDGYCIGTLEDIENNNN